MYVVTLYNGELETVIHGVKQRLMEGKIVKGINTIDTFTFSMLPSNAGFHLCNEFTTRVSVYNIAKKRYDFIGRVLYPETRMDDNGLITKQVTCESIAAYLCDSQQAYVETQNWTVLGLLNHLISCHNSQVEEYKRFYIGTVTATDKNDNLYLGIQRENTWDSIGEKLVKQIGGELRFRVEDGVNYIDYLEAVGEEKATAISISVNMKSVTREQNPTGYITRLIPLGCKLTKEVEKTDEQGNVTTETVETEERLDIASVNNGLNYIDDAEAIAVYGIHVGTVIWDDVTTPGVLKTKAEALMKENNKVQVKYSITALDLSIIGLAIDDFDVGNYHPIKNPLLGIDDVARIIKKTVNICEPHESSIEVGDNFKTLSDIQREQAAAIKKAQNELDETAKDLANKINKVVSDLDKRVTKIEGIDGLYFYIKYSQYADGHDMTDVPNESTEYMGTCSTNQETAPVDYTKYTWCKIRGADGKDGANGKDGTDGIPGEPGADGKTQYLHIKYSDDGETFTAGTPNLLSTDVSDWAKHSLDEDGTITEAKRNIHTVEMIPVNPGAVYTVGAKTEESYVMTISYYAAQDYSTYISVEILLSKNKEITIPADVNFVAVNFGYFSFSDSVTFENVLSDMETGVTIPFIVPGNLASADDFVSPGETLGAWIGTLVDFNEADSIAFSDYTWKKFTEDVDEELEQIREDFKTEIEQLSNSIKLELTGSLGSHASIILSAGKNQYTGDLDLSQIRKAFANDPTAISISAGIITFNSNTIVINSTNFSVTSAGVITAKSGTIGAITLSETGIYSHNANYSGSHAGWYKPATLTTSDVCFFAGATDASGKNANFAVTYGGKLTATDATIYGEIISIDSLYKTTISDGCLKLYYMELLCGEISTRYHSNSTTYGIELSVEQSGSYIMFTHKTSSTAFVVDYVLNNGWTSNYPETHIFYSDARFVDDLHVNDVFFHGIPRTASNVGIYGLDKAGEHHRMIAYLTGGSVGCIVVGNNYTEMELWGSTILLANGATVTSDRNEKNSIEIIPDKYEAFFDGLQPVRFKYNEGTSGRYHMGYIAQDVESALVEAGLDTSEFAGYVDIEGTGKLGLVYEEFIALLHQKIKRLENRIRVLESQ